MKDDCSTIHLDTTQALGLHSHNEHQHRRENPLTHEEILGKVLAVLAAIYAFYLFERVMMCCLGHHTHGEGAEEQPDKPGRVCMLLLHLMINIHNLITPFHWSILPVGTLSLSASHGSCKIKQILHSRGNMAHYFHMVLITRHQVMTGVVCIFST